MSGFSAAWLALREPVDAASRNAELTAQLVGWRQTWADSSRPSAGIEPGARDDVLFVLDLGSGTGANWRFLAPVLGGKQRWRLVDHDPALLAQNAAFSLCPAERRCLDLTRDWALLDFRGVQLVTASALIDLVSADWLERLARRCREIQAAVFIVLSYDGAISWEPALSGDQTVRAWVNQHQRTDKGFGPALGPLAAPAFQAMLERLGYRVDRRPSPWRLEPEQAAMQTALLDGWVAAVREVAPDATNWLDEWASQRRCLIERRLSRLRVGHWDLLATAAAGFSIPQRAVK